MANLGVQLTAKLGKLQDSADLINAQIPKLEKLLQPLCLKAHLDGKEIKELSKQLVDALGKNGAETKVKVDSSSLDELKKKAKDVGEELQKVTTTSTFSLKDGTEAYNQIEKYKTALGEIRTEYKLIDAITGEVISVNSRLASDIDKQSKSMEKYRAEWEKIANASQKNMANPMFQQDEKNNSLPMVAEQVKNTYQEIFDLMNKMGQQPSLVSVEDENRLKGLLNSLKSANNYTKQYYAEQQAKQQELAVLEKQRLELEAKKNDLMAKGKAISDDYLKLMQGTKSNSSLINTKEVTSLGDAYSKVANIVAKIKKEENSKTGITPATIQALEKATNEYDALYESVRKYSLEIEKLEKHKQTMTNFNNTGYSYSSEDIAKVEAEFKKIEDYKAKIAKQQMVSQTDKDILARMSQSFEQTTANVINQYKVQQQEADKLAKKQQEQNEYLQQQEALYKEISNVYMGIIKSTNNKTSLIDANGAKGLADQYKQVTEAIKQVRKEEKSTEGISDQARNNLKTAIEDYNKIMTQTRAYFKELENINNAQSKMSEINGSNKAYDPQQLALVEQEFKKIETYKDNISKKGVVTQQDKDNLAKMIADFNKYVSTMESSYSAKNAQQKKDIAHEDYIFNKRKDLLALQERINNLASNTKMSESAGQGLYDELNKAMGLLQIIKNNGNNGVDLFGKQTNLNQAIKSLKDMVSQEEKLQKAIANADKEQKKLNLDVENLKKVGSARLDLLEVRGGDIEKITELRNRLASLDPASANAREEISKLRAELTTLDTQTRANTTSFRGLFNSFNNLLSSVTGVYLGMMGAGNGIRSMIEETTTLADSIIGLKRVTDETNETYENLKGSMFNVAGEIGGQASELIDSMTEFSKLGYAFDKAQEYAETASKYARAGELSMEEATNAMVASLTVFNDEVTNSMEIADLYNAIGNQLSISSGQVGSAMERSANALKSANNTIEQSVALIATAQKTVQDAEKVGNAWKTVSMRLRGVKSSEDGEELDANLGKIIEETTAKYGKAVKIFDKGKQEFLSTYEIVKQISEVWFKMTDAEQAMLAEKIAGKNRAEVFLATLNNAQDLEKAMQVAEQSAGSIDKEMSIFMDSYSAKMEQLKNAWAELANATLDSEWIKDIVDGLTKTVQTITELGGVVPILKGLLAIVVAFKAQKIASGIVELVTGLGSNIGAIGTMLTGVTQGFGAMQQVLGGTATVAQVAGTALTGLMTTLGLVGVALTAVTLGVKAYNNYQEEQIRKTNEATTQLKRDEQAIEDYAKKYEELYQALNNAKGNEEETYEIKKQMLELQIQLNEKYGEECGKIDLVTDAYNNQAEAIRKLADEKNKDWARENREGIQKATEAMTEKKTYKADAGVFYNQLEINEEFGSIYNRLLSQFESKGVEDFKSNTGLVTLRFKEDAEGAKKVISEMMDSIEEELASNNLSQATEDALNALLDSLSEQLGKANDIIDKNGETFRKSLINKMMDNEEVSATYGKLEEAVNSYNEALAKEDDTKLRSSLETINEIKNTVSNNEEFSQFALIFNDVFNALDTSMGQLQTDLMNNKDGMEQFFNTFKNKQDVDIKAMINADSIAPDIQKLKSYADEYGMSIDALIQLMVKLGYIQSQTFSEAPTEIAPVMSTDLTDQFDLYIDKSDELKDALRQLQETRTIEEGTLEKLAKKYPELLQYMDSYENQIKGITIALAQQKVNDYTTEINDLIGIQEDLQENYKLTTSSIEKLTKSFPELIQFMGNEKALESEIIKAIEDRKNAQNSAYQEMIAYSESFYNSTLLLDTDTNDSLTKALQDLVDANGENYQVDLKNFKTVEEAKVAIAQACASQALAAWAGYMNAQGMYDLDKIQEEGYDESQFADMYAEAEQYNLMKKKMDEIFSQAMGNISIDSGEDAGKKGRSSSSSKNYSYIEQGFADEIAQIENLVDNSQKEIDAIISKIDYTSAMHGQDNQLVKNLRDKLELAYEDRKALLEHSADDVRRLGDGFLKELQGMDSYFKQFSNFQELTKTDLDTINRQFEQSLQNAEKSNNDGAKQSLTLTKGRVNELLNACIEAKTTLDDLGKDWFDNASNSLEEFKDQLDTMIDNVKNRQDSANLNLDLEMTIAEDGEDYQKQIQLTQKLLDDKIALQQSYLSAYQSCLDRGMSEEEDYVRELKQLYMEMENDIYEYKKQLLEKQKELDEKRIDDIQGLRDSVVSMLKSKTDEENERLDEQIKLLDKKKDDEMDYIDAQKKELDNLKKIHDRQKKIDEAKKKFAQIQSELNTLEFAQGDAELMANKAGLLDELTDAKDDLMEEYFDQSIDIQKEILDNLKDARQDYYDNAKRALQDQKDANSKLKDSDYYAKADSMIKTSQTTNAWDSLFKALLEWNKKYGDGIDATIIEMFKPAKETLQQFNLEGKNILDILNGLANSSFNASEAMKTISATSMEGTQLNPRFQDGFSSLGVQKIVEGFQTVINSDLLNGINTAFKNAINEAKVNSNKQPTQVIVETKVETPVNVNGYTSSELLKEMAPSMNSIISRALEISLGKLGNIVNKANFR